MYCSATPPRSPGSAPARSPSELNQSWIRPSTISTADAKTASGTGNPMRKFSVCLAAILALPLPSLADVTGPQDSIADNGAIPDGATLNTKAIQYTIDHLAATGGGTVVIPKG